MADEVSAVPSAARIDALIDDMEQCAWTYRKSPDPDARAEANTRWHRALYEIAELRRERARAMAATTGLHRVEPGGDS